MSDVYVSYDYYQIESNAIILPNEWSIHMIISVPWIVLSDVNTINENAVTKPILDAIYSKTNSR